MKKLFAISTMLLLAIILTACNNSRQVVYSPYMPFTDNLLLVYTIEGPSLYDTFLIFNSYVNENRAQRFTQLGGGTTIVDVVEMIDGRAVIIFNDSDVFAPHADITDVSQQMFYVVLPGVIETGIRWRANPLVEGDTAMKEITGIDVIVTTPAGTFSAIEITLTGHSDREYIVEPVRRMYFAEDIGMVKQRDYTGIPIEHAGQDLDSIQQGVHVTELVEVIHDGLIGETFTFHADAQNSVPSVPVHITTNNALLDVLNTVLRDSAYATFGLDLPSDVRIVSYFANANNRNLHLDFSAGFLREMERTATQEAEEHLLLAIVDIFGIFFNAQGVAITVEEQPFAGRYTALRSMEFLPVGGSFAHLPTPPLYTPEELVAVRDIVREIQPILASAVAQISTYAHSSEGFVYDDEGVPFLRALNGFSMQEMLDLMYAVFTPHFIYNTLEPIMWSPYFPYFVEIDGAVHFRADVDNPIPTSIYWAAWRAEDLTIIDLDADFIWMQNEHINIVFAPENGVWFVDFVSVR